MYNCIMADFEILLSPREKWRRLSLLLKSRNITQLNIHYTYNTFEYEEPSCVHELDWYLDKEFDQGIDWLEREIKHLWNINCMKNNN